jgi:EAL domain-containing protein (putative c-di-GMP-specific phosphodiesterase class I)
VCELGCTEAQGYYIGKPQPFTELAGLLDAYLPRRAKSA